MALGAMALFAAVGAGAYTSRITEYINAGRRVPAFYNGLVLATAALGGAGITGLAGTLFLVGFGAPLSFYLAAQRERLRSWANSLRYVPALMAVGIGIGFNNALAALDGFFGKTGEFVRTPKFGDRVAKRGVRRHQRRGGRRLRILASWKAWAELAIGLYLSGFLLAFFFHEEWYERVSAAIPFLLLFIVGYFYMAFLTFYGRWRSEHEHQVAAA